MSITITLPTPWRRRSTEWCETDAVALAVAGVTSIRVQKQTVRAVVTESLRVYGGAEGVQAELQRRLAEEGHHMARTLEWARRTIASVTVGAAA